MTNDLDKNLVKELPTNVIPLRKDHLWVNIKGDMRRNTGIKVYLQSFHSKDIRWYTIKSTTNIDDMMPWINAGKAWLLTGSEPIFNGVKI